jgi:hypothetical protein
MREDCLRCHRNREVDISRIEQVQNTWRVKFPQEFCVGRGGFRVEILAVVVVCVIISVIIKSLRSPVKTTETKVRSDGFFHRTQMISLVRQGLGIAHVTMTQTVAVEETVVEGETKAAANNISTANNMFLAKVTMSRF